MSTTPDVNSVCFAEPFFDFNEAESTAFEPMRALVFNRALSPEKERAQQLWPDQMLQTQAVEVPVGIALLSCALVTLKPAGWMFSMSVRFNTPLLSHALYPSLRSSVRVMDYWRGDLLEPEDRLTHVKFYMRELQGMCHTFLTWPVREHDVKKYNLKT